MSLQPLSLQQEAVHESTSCARLIELSKISTLLAQLVAKNSSAPSKLLRELSNSSDVITRQNVAANPNTPTDVLLNLGGEFPEQLLNNPIFSLSWLENPKLFDVIPQTTLLSLLKQESVPVFLLKSAVKRLDSKVQSVAEEDFCDVMTLNLNFKAQLELAIAMNAQTPKTLLEKLAYSQYVEVQKTAQLHINISEEMTSGWDEAARDAIRTTTFTDPLARGFSQYIENLEKRGLIPEYVLKQLVEHQDKTIRSIVAHNCDTSVNLLEGLAQDKGNCVPEGAAKNPNTPLNVLTQRLEQLAQDGNVIQRWHVASNPNTPLKLLEQLAQDENGVVREAVALHPNTPVSLVLEITLKRYSQDSWLSLSRFLVLLHPQAPAKALAENSRSLVWLERYAIAQNANTPTDTLKALALDANRIVRAAAKANLNRIVPATAKANLPSRNPTRAEAEQLYQQAVQQKQSGQLLAAIRCWEQALGIYQEIGDRKRQADTLRDLGFAFQSIGQYEQAIESHQQAFAINREMGDRSGEAASLINLGSVFDSLEQYQQAIEFYQEGLLIAQQIGHRRWEANALHNLGLAYSGKASSLSKLGLAYDFLGQYQKAIDYLQQALTLQREIGDHSGEGSSLCHLGNAYSSLREHQQAVDCYQQALSVLQHIGHRQFEPNTLIGLGHAHDDLEQYQKVIKYHQQYLAPKWETGDKAGIDSYSSLISLGSVYYFVGQYQKAIEYYQQALDIARQIGHRCREAKALGSLGYAYHFLGQYHKAIEFHQQALILQREIGDRIGEANSLNGLGIAYDSQGQYQKANEYHQHSLAKSREIGSKEGIAGSLLNLGLSYACLGQYQKSIELYRQGLDIAWQIGHRRLEANALLNSGIACASIEQYPKAIEYYQQGITVIESIQDELTIEELKASFVDKYISGYERLIVLLRQEGRIKEAFNYVERSRARAFLDQFANGPINFRTGVSAKLLQQEETIKAQIAALRTQLTQLLTQERSLHHQISAIRSQLVKLRSHPSDQLDTEAIASVQKQLLSLEKNYTNLLTELKLQSPEAASLVSVDVATLDEIQSLLDADTTLVEYFVTENLTLAFVITCESFKTVSIEVSREDLTKKIEAFRGFGLKNLKNPHPKSLQQLYEWLIAPLKPWLTTNKLAIVPHGVLHYLPFAALSTGDRYLCDDYTIITLPSASILRFLPQKRKPSTGTLLALGNPTTTEPLPSLPFAEQEVNAIASLYGTQPLVGAEATESVVFSQAGSAEILHLSAHGEFNKYNPLFSTLHLAPDAQHDGRLEVHDIYTLDLTTATNLVVLSACQTQLGELSRGDEVVGLNRAFLYAGTPNVMATLWSVSDKVTGLLMECFYTHVRSGMALAQALRQAQIEVRAEYPHPYYWAAFVLTGDGGTSIAL